MKLISALTAGTLIAAGGVVVLAGPASSSALTTRCNGTASGVTVPGTLVVPAGASCDLTDVVVTGNVRVAAGGDLVAEASEFRGGVTVQQDGFLGLIDSTVANRVTSQQGFGVALEGSSAGSVVTRAVQGSAVEAITWIEEGSSLSGILDASVGEVLVSSSTVGGNVTGNGTVFTDVVDSTLSRGLTVTGNEEGAVFVESEVYGDATYTGNDGVLQLGADGPVEIADTASFWGGNVTLTDNAADISVDNNIVAGNLTGTGNTGVLTVGESNRVRGELGGQFAAPAPAEASVAALSAVAEVEERQAATQERLDERVAAAEAAALDAGDAGL